MSDNADQTVAGCCGPSIRDEDAERSVDAAFTGLRTESDAGRDLVDVDGDPSPPVVVIGAGPVGLAAAAHLAERGLDFLVLEAGDRVGAAIAEWGHVRLFSPWRHDTDTAARRLLEPTGWTPPPGDALPTGDELLRDCLTPLAAVPALAGRILTGTRVVAVTRDGIASPAPWAARSARCWSAPSRRTAPSGAYGPGR
ncbi:FAD-dependent oxidoreductase [Thermomonospora umbrina]|uniref:FAD-dependent oxidoreductase n=1 Tax=Thermomonospora umbrina TaxID=111806 RepID=UPI001B882E2D|nr:FAD-dependent oxidoreductase [Thermomonospora umbrina]